MDEKDYYPGTEKHAAPVRGLAVCSAGMGFFASCVYWWFPFGIMIGAVALILGVISVIFGIRASTIGDHVGIIGAAFAMNAVAIGLTVYRGLHVIMTDYITPPQF